MRFWDSSAIVPLLIAQESSVRQQKLMKKDQTLLVCWLSQCECFSALARLERERKLSFEAFQAAHKRLLALSRHWHVVAPEVALEEETKRVLRLHPLRCADALQLASAVLASEKNPGSLEFVTLDECLARAAAKEGFPLVDA